VTEVAFPAFFYRQSTDDKPEIAGPSLHALADAVIPLQALSSG